MKKEVDNIEEQLEKKARQELFKIKLYCNKQNRIKQDRDWMMIEKEKDSRMEIINYYKNRSIENRMNKNIDYLQYEGINI